MMLHNTTVCVILLPKMPATAQTLGHLHWLLSFIIQHSLQPFADYILPDFVELLRVWRRPLLRSPRSLWNGNVSKCFRNLSNPSHPYMMNNISIFYQLEAVAELLAMQMLILWKLLAPLPFYTMILIFSFYLHVDAIWNNKAASVGRWSSDVYLKEELVEFLKLCHSCTIELQTITRLVNYRNNAQVITSEKSKRSEDLFKINGYAICPSPSPWIDVPCRLSCLPHQPNYCCLSC